MADSNHVSNVLHPLVALRSIKGTILKKLNTNEDIELPSCRVFTFSEDGILFVLCNLKSVKIYCDGIFSIPFWEIPKPRTVDIKFSPKNTFVAIWEQVSSSGDTEQSNQLPCNLQIYDWKKKLLVAEFVQKKQIDWCPQWTEDEQVCMRIVNNEVICFEASNFEQVKCKLHLPKLNNFSLAKTTSAPYRVAVSAPGSKGQPSFVRLFEYPKFSTTDAIANKSFFKAERTELFWNNAGTSLLILTSSEVSADSYYGEQQLHFVGVKTESCMVPRAKNGPIYCVAWNPNSKEFCIVYGYMPAKATLYNLKCEPIFDFGTGPRNLAYFNPFGNMLCLAGFGNLSGNIEFWDVQKQKQLNKFTAPDTTYFQWSSDGVHFIAATLTPRLRVNNGFKIYHYSGEVVMNWKTEELYAALWQPRSLGSFPEPVLKFTQSQQAIVIQVAAAKPTAYLPPALRNKTESEISAVKSKFREDFEPPSNLKSPPVNKTESKNTQKNRKKRENRKAKKLEEGQIGATANSDQTSDKE